MTMIKISRLGYLAYMPQIHRHPVTTTAFSSFAQVSVAKIVLPTILGTSQSSESLQREGHLNAPCQACPFYW